MSKSTKLHKSVKDFILAITNIDSFIVDLCQHGGCYKFHLVLKGIYPDALPYWNESHVGTKIGDHFYDINGEMFPKTKKYYSPMTESAIKAASIWKPMKGNQYLLYP